MAEQVTKVNRFRNPLLWGYLLILVATVLKLTLKLDIPNATIDLIVNLVLTILAALGVIYNPTAPVTMENITTITKSPEQ